MLLWILVERDTPRVYNSSMSVDQKTGRPSGHQASEKNIGALLGFDVFLSTHVRHGQRSILD